MGRLLDIGRWLGVNGEAIYNTTYFATATNYTGGIYFTQSVLDKSVAYVIVIGMLLGCGSVSSREQPVTCMPCVHAGGHHEGESISYKNGPIPSGSTVWLMMMPETVACSQRVWYRWSCLGMAMLLRQ